MVPVPGRAGQRSRYPQLLADERAEARRVFFADRVALGFQLPERGVGVDGGLHHHSVKGQAGGRRVGSRACSWPGQFIPRRRRDHCPPGTARLLARPAQSQPATRHHRALAGNRTLRYQLA